MNSLQIHSNDAPPLSSTAVSDALANIGQVAQALLQSGLVPVQDVSGAGPGEGSLPEQFHGLGAHSGIPHPGHSDTESDGELEDFAEENAEAGHRLTTASVDAQATKSDEAWTPEEEEELVKLVAHEDYRKVRLGDTSTKWAPIAAHFSRTVKAVKRKFDKLQNPGKEHRKSRGTRGSASAGPSGAVMGLPGVNPYLPLVGQMTAPTSELLAGLYMGDANAMAVAGLTQYPGAGSLPHGLSAEQAAAVLGAGGAGAGVAPAMTAEALSAYLGQAFPAQAVGGYGGLYDASGASDGGAGGLMGLPPGYSDALLAQLQYASPASGYGGGAGLLTAGGTSMTSHAAAAAAHHHGLSAALSAGTGAATPGGSMSSAQAPHHDRRFWNEADQQELLRLAGDPQYRQALLGTAELNWDLIARQLGRGKRSVQRKYDNLKGTSLPTASGASILPINDGKKWSTEEVSELLRLVEDSDYRKETLGLDKVEWRSLGQHFGRSYESVSYKYSYVKNTGRMETKTKHAKAKHETSYKEMAVWALSQLPNGDGTSGQICAVIMTNPLFAPQLDTAIVSGKKTLQRWKHGVRSALNAFSMFVKTGGVRDGEVIWRLDTDALAAEQAAHAEKAARQRNKPLSGAQRRKLKKQQAAAQAAAEAAAAAGGTLPQLLATPAQAGHAFGSPADAIHHHQATALGLMGNEHHDTTASHHAYGYATDLAPHHPETDAVAHSEEGAHEALARMAQQGRGVTVSAAALADYESGEQGSRRRPREDGGAEDQAPAPKRFEPAVDYGQAAYADARAQPSVSPRPSSANGSQTGGGPVHAETLPPELQVPLLQMIQSEPLSTEQMQSLLSAQLASGVPLHLLGTADGTAGATGGYYSATGGGQGPGGYSTEYDAAAAAAAAAAAYGDYYGTAGTPPGGGSAFGAAELAALQVVPHDGSLGLGGGASAGGHQADAFASLGGPAGDPLGSNSGAQQPQASASNGMQYPGGGYDSRPHSHS